MRVGKRPIQTTRLDFQRGSESGSGRGNGANRSFSSEFDSFGADVGLRSMILFSKRYEEDSNDFSIGDESIDSDENCTHETYLPG